MSETPPLAEILMPVVNALMPAKTVREYEANTIPFTLWGSLHPQRLNGRLLGNRCGLYFKNLLRADHFGAPLAVNLVERFQRGTNTGYSQVIWPTWQMNALRGLDTKKRTEEYQKYRVLRMKMNDMQFLGYLIGHATGTATSSTGAYQNVFITYKATAIASSVRNYLELQDWWQMEGLKFQSAFPTQDAYDDGVRMNIPDGDLDIEALIYGTDD